MTSSREKIEKIIRDSVTPYKCKPLKKTEKVNTILKTKLREPTPINKKFIFILIYVFLLLVAFFNI